MGDLSATGCCGGGGFGGNNCCWIIILLLLCGNCGGDCGFGGSDGCGFGGGNCCWIIICSFFAAAVATVLTIPAVAADANIL